MRALVLKAEPRVVENWPTPRRSPGEARIAVDLAGVCDTDLQLARGYLSHRGVLGHEFVGRVLEAEDGAWLGRRVVADINVGCGACPNCVGKDEHHCRQRSVLGIVQRDGAFAEQLVIPERCLVLVPDVVTDEQAVFAEPLAAAAHVLDDAAVAEASRVVVLGDGKLGLLVSLVLVAAGKDTTIVGRHPRKLALAARAGARGCLESAASEIARAPVVVEATGSSSGMARAQDLVASRGTIIVKTTIADQPALDLARLVIDEVRLVGSRCGNLSSALQLLESKSVDPRPLIEARYPLTAGEAALAHAKQRGALKVLIRCNPDQPSGLAVSGATT